MQSKNKIDMANPYVYKEHLLKYAFDRGHLNEMGQKYIKSLANGYY